MWWKSDFKISFMFKGYIDKRQVSVKFKFNLFVKKGPLLVFLGYVVLAELKCEIDF